ncbi:hypothetical protein RF007C_13150 [Ruminococcus flavefaciens 007c]|uniref:Uncharacterized protein n=1 Tax=Ruminococcus flavefaciens 007c TaxID=1341157 RepID=W7UL37_RUMFL|nr:hypothetical protein RF007C_13150 [Ruminococcus flavefaciens 007c]
MITESVRCSAGALSIFSGRAFPQDTAESSLSAKRAVIDNPIIIRYNFRNDNSSITKG